MIKSIFELAVLVWAIRSIPRTRSVRPDQVKRGHRILFNFLGTGPYLSAPVNYTSPPWNLTPQWWFSFEGGGHALLIEPEPGQRVRIGR